MDVLWQRILLLTFNILGYKMESVILTISHRVVNYLSKITYFKILTQWKCKIKHYLSSSPCGSAVMNLTSIQEDVGLIPGLTQWVRIWQCHGLQYGSQTRLGSCVAVARLAVTARIRPLGWKLPCSLGVGLKRQKTKKKIVNIILKCSYKYFVWY